MRILIAEDEIELAKGLKYILEKERYNVDIVHDGGEAVDYFEAADYDLIILDIMMPVRNGMEVLSHIRKTGSPVHIMMLSARSEIEDRVAGLEGGADDYLPKPFATKEFVARVKALMRRSEGYTPQSLIFADTELNCGTYEMICGHRTVKLSNMEYRLAELFFKNPHRIFSTEYIMDTVWGYESNAEINVVWTNIGYVRKKLKLIEAGVSIRNNRGAGYSLEEDA